MRRNLFVRSAVVGLALFAGAGLVGCAEVRDAVGDRANQAACDAVEPLATEVGNQVAVAAADITVNPEGALTTLGSLRTKALGRPLRLPRLNRLIRSSTKVNNTGITSRLRKVLVMSPPITTMAMGARKLGSVPNPKAMGNMPAAMAMVVMMIGRARLWQASRMASQRFMPRSRRARMT